MEEEKKTVNLGTSGIVSSSMCRVLWAGTIAGLITKSKPKQSHDAGRHTARTGLPGKDEEPLDDKHM